jgi:predicted PurR-regulated permease PerM
LPGDEEARRRLIDSLDDRVAAPQSGAPAWLPSGISRHYRTLPGDCKISRSGHTLGRSVLFALQPGRPAVSRIVSFVVLAAIVVVFGVLFYRVMASFLLPLFLAVVLVVLFRPLNLWLVEMCKGRVRVAAGLTTFVILLIVLLPLLLILGNAAAEGWSLFKSWDQDVSAELNKLRRGLGLELPPPGIRTSLETTKKVLASAQAETIPGEADFDHRAQSAPLRGEIKGIREWIAAQPPAHSPTRLFRRANLSAAADAAQELESSLGELAATDRDDASFRGLLHEARLAYDRLEQELLGSTMVHWVRDKANPTAEEMAEWRVWLQGWVAPAARNTGGALVSFLIGLGVMILAMYYFLADGPAMLHGLLAMSPLEKRYEEQLLQQFAKISRAVVTATLLSALAQGVLAGIGYKLAGMNSVFLLSVLTMFLAMVPFIGATAVWLPCCLWLFLSGHPMAGGFLAIYGLVIVSMVDNLIKPYILHGQSNLHPLLALLSVLGGVRALGPIGIFVGPMAVVFLQTLLKMLHTELTALGQHAGEGSGA